MSVFGRGELNSQRAQALQCSLILLGKRGWFGKDRGECLSLWGLPQRLEFKGMQCESAPWGQRGKMLAWEEGRQCSPWPQKVVREWEMCRVCTEPRHIVLKHAPWNGAGVSRQWLTQPLLPRARIQLLFMASSVCRSGSQPRQETIWLRGARELLSWYLQIKGEELKTVVRVQLNLITSRDFISSKKCWIANLCA